MRVDRVPDDDALQLAGSAGAAGDPGKLGLNGTRWAVLASGIAVTCAGPASADATDDAVVAALAKRNIVINDDNRDAMLDEAHMVCEGLDKHYKTSTLAMKLVGDTDLNFSQSTFFIGVAMSAYCPQYKGHNDSAAR